MSESPDQTPLLEAADQGTPSLVPCGSCGYNVRGFAAGSRCPACNATISSPLPRKIARIRKLAASDSAWLKKLAGGMSWILGGIVASIVAGVGGVVIAAQTHSLAYGPPLYLLAGLVLCVGGWRITTREPGQAPEEGSCVRLLFRYGQVMSLAVGAFASQTILASPLWWAGLIGSGTLYVLFVIAGFTHVHQLAVRIPDDELASQTETVRWGFPLAIILSYVWSILRFSEATIQQLPAGDGEVTGTSVGISFPDNGFGSWTGLLGWFAGPVQLIFGIWAIVLVVRYRRALANVAREALSARAAGVEPERQTGTEE